MRAGWTIKHAWVCFELRCLFTHVNDHRIHVLGDAIEQRNSLYQDAKNEYWNSCCSKISDVSPTGFYPDRISLLYLLFQIIISERMLRMFSWKNLYHATFNWVLRISSIFLLFSSGWLEHLYLKRRLMIMVWSGIFFFTGNKLCTICFRIPICTFPCKVTCTTLHNGQKNIKCLVSLCLLFWFPPSNNSFYSYCVSKPSFTGDL